MGDMPWFRFFPSDWLAGTRGMSAAETGVYITLIATMYEHGEPIPEDDARLSRLCGASLTQFRKALSTLVSEGKIIRSEGTLWNERVGKECSFRNSKSTTAKNAAKKRWDEKPNKNNGTRDADALPAQCERNAIPEARSQKPDKELFSESENLSGGGSGEPRQMAFVGKVIRLTFADFERWRSSYSAIPDIRAELEAADAYYADNQPKDGKWFFPVSNWLKRENNRHLQQEREERGSRATWN
ncbi:MAG: YdaU family protein [Parvibaculum sp.]|nr:YdaU family protein [Parvibaculum sp.]